MRDAHAWHGWRALAAQLQRRQVLRLHHTHGSAVRKDSFVHCILTSAIGSESTVSKTIAFLKHAILARSSARQDKPLSNTWIQCCPGIQPCSFQTPTKEDQECGYHTGEVMQCLHSSRRS